MPLSICYYLQTCSGRFPTICYPVTTNGREARMQDAGTEVPMPANEPVLSYAPGTPEREALEAEIERMRSGAEEIPLIIGAER
jgi:hypothetical protein